MIRERGEIAPRGIVTDHLGDTGFEHDTKQEPAKQEAAGPGGRLQQDGEEAGPKDGIFKNFFVCEQVINDCGTNLRFSANSSLW